MRKTHRPPPVPQGHVILDGLVQAAGDNLRVAMDITVSFDPETFGGMTFHRIEVRYVARNLKRLPQLQVWVVRTEREIKAEERRKSNIIQAAAALRSGDKARDFMDKRNQEKKTSSQNSEDKDGEEETKLHQDPEQIIEKNPPAPSSADSEVPEKTKQKPSVDDVASKS